MKITLTGSFSTRTAYYDSNTGEYGQSFDGKVGPYKAFATQNHASWFAPGSGEAWNTGYQNTLSDMKVTLAFTARQTDGYSEDELTMIFYQMRPLDGVSDTDEDLYESITGNRYMGFVAKTQTIKTDISSSGTTVTVDITDTASIGYLLQYGVGFKTSANTYMLSNMTLSLTGESSEAPPVLSLNASGMAGTVSGGTYYHPAGDTEFTVSVKYSQELGTKLAAMRYIMKDAAGETITTVSVSGTTFTIDRAYWAALPASGTLEITATSAHGIPSEALVLPWVVTHYDLHVTTPVSGAIIQSGDDVVLAWNLVLPDGMPSAPMPTRYTIWPAWDDAEEFQVAYGTTERTYTIPSDSLAGHTKLKLLILDEYGTDGASVRRMDSGTLILLYLQPSASLHGIMVGTEHTTGQYTPLLTVLWDSDGQTAYQLTADDFDSGAVWGTGQQYTIPRLFDDGVHVIRLRIQDANGTWGEWSDPVYVDVANRAVTGTVMLSAQKATTGAKLAITGSGSALQYADVLIYRNGVLIAQLPGTTTLKYEYTDTEASGVNTYYVRLAVDHGFYAQSDTVTIDATPGTDGILLPDGTWIALKYTQEFPRMYQSTQSEETYEQYYAGRAYPVFMRTGRKTKQITKEYIDKGRTICDALEAAAGSVVLYKTTLGDVIRGELNSVTAGRGTAWSTVSFRLLQSDEPADLTYTPGVNSVAI